MSVELKQIQITGGAADDFSSTMQLLAEEAHKSVKTERVKRLCRFQEVLL
jgi:hypothetical protein